MMSLKIYIQTLNKTEVLCHNLFLITFNAIIINDIHLKNFFIIYIKNYN